MKRPRSRTRHAFFNQSRRDQKEPQDIPEWHSLRREAALVRHLIGSGVTSLGKASYGDKIGEYYIAFFGLSIGLERLAKLAIVANYAIAHNGQMPTNLSRFGHKLVRLLNCVDNFTAEHSLNLTFPRPTTQISNVIVECLDAFADASRGRYANFAALGDPNLRHEEPISTWWDQVAELILAEHYCGTPSQRKVEAGAKGIDAAISPFTKVLYTDERGDGVTDVRSALILTAKTKIVQRYGRFHALSVVRWLSDVFSQMSTTACYKHQVHAFSGVWEYLATYRVDDSFLKTRKIWPLV